MSACSNYLERKILDHTLGEGGRNYTSPTLYVALFTGTAATTKANLENASMTNEVPNSYSYSRQALNFDAATTDSSGVTTAVNSATVTFPAASGGSWGTVTVIALVDSATHGAGNVLYYGELTSSKTVNDADVFQISQGQLSVALA